MPPKSHWRGDIRPTENPPHETDWVICADGEEIARAQEQADLADVIGKRLTLGKS